MDHASAVEPRPQRADSRRTVEQIVVAAVQVLGDDPAAPMERVADAAGAHRATLYRYFPTRDRLVGAVAERALAEGRGIVEDATRLPPGPEAVRQLAEATVSFGGRYGFLTGSPMITAAGPDPIGLAALMARWQDGGLLQRSATAEWLAASFIALAQALFVPGAVPDDRARSALLTEMFLRGGGT